ncbi:hypothetical protein HK100_007313 [Physocladia obscura]|uniref:Phosphoserine aminotransferase n=1 Tax=Physocladia obscura TaxID=109957 RepID=A0AAD5SR12_9FUNG|nr:hypothetical protein HK100_007313 [Physocladia obscura]
MKNTRFDNTGKRILNFSAGPGLMPATVLATAAAEMSTFSQGHSLMELSHRSAPFEKLLEETEVSFRRLLNIPSNYKVLFMQGGATLQFSCIALNLCAGANAGTKADYIVTGAWSQKGHEEAVRLLGSDRVNLVVNTKSSKHNGDIPPLSTWNFSDKQSFVFYCDNETVHGVEFGSKFPFHAIAKDVPIVCDMSSSILSQPVDVSKFGLIFAGAQKNMGPAGVTVVIVREDLLVASYKYPQPFPLMLDYSTYATSHSMHNTPPTYPIYLCGLVFKWLETKIGGLIEMEKINAAKAACLYEAIENSNGFYSCPVKKDYRSRMNVTFLVKGDFEKEFLAEAEKNGMIQLAGHRSVGGVRASLYNAMPLDGVQALVSFMKEFASARF